MRWFAVACRSLVPIVSLFAGVGLARAQTAPSGASDKVAAESLFEEARKLTAQGKYADACPKFADSQKMDPSPSTLLNLANCWEKLGRTATAWATYREAESAANAAKRFDYMATAQRHADALAPTLARLTIKVEQPIAGMQLRRDAVSVGPAQWGVAIPIDKGPHTLEADAPGYKKWAAQVDVAQDGAQLAASVPPLDALPAEPLSAAPESAVPTVPGALAPATREAPAKRSSQSTIGLIVGGAGVVGLAASGVITWLAIDKRNKSLDNCSAAMGDPNACTPAGVRERNDARTLGDVDTIVFAVGAAALATGVVLWLSAPGGAAPRTARVAIAPALGGAVVAGTW